MKRINIAVAVVIILSMVLAACAPAAPVPTAEIQQVEMTQAPVQPAAPAGEGKVITVGVNSENPPWIFMDGGTMTGFEADIVEEFAKRAGYEIEYKSAPFATVLTGVQSGQWDVAMSSIWVKAERVEVMDFADPYYDAQIGLMAPTEGGITAFDQMKGLVFGSDTGSANEAWLQEAQAKYGPYEVKSYDYWADAVMDLQAGRIDGVVVDAPIALYWIKQNPDAGISMPLYITDYNFAQALAFQKGSPLVAEFNAVQNEMKKDGTLAAIHKKWFVSDPPADSCAINECPPYLPNEKPAMAAAEPVAPAKEYDPDATITVAMETILENLDYMTNSTLNAAGIFEMMYDRLVNLDDNVTLQPMLATEWSVSEDGKVWTFKLRDDVKFWDGTPLTAKDVKYTMERMQEDAYNIGNTNYLNTQFLFDKAVVVDDYTIEIYTKTPVPALLYTLEEINILLRAHLQRSHPRTGRL